MNHDTKRDTISLDFEVPISVHRLDPVALIEAHKEDWDRLDAEWLRQHGYQPWERFPVFISKFIASNLSVVTGLAPYAEHIHDGWADVDTNWTPEHAERLDFLLDETSTAAMDRDPNVLSLFADPDGE